MEIRNIEGLTFGDLKRELEEGGKFVIFSYCVSVVAMTFKRGSSVYYIRPKESAFKFHWKHSIVSFLIGWWGIPWGPVYTIGSLYTNFSGGKDVTYEVVNALYHSKKAE